MGRSTLRNETLIICDNSIGYIIKVKVHPHFIEIKDEWFRAMRVQSLVF